MTKTKSNLDFRLMALSFSVRDFFQPREEILKEVGIKPGFYILDYGCGSGGYTIPAAQMVGEAGKIYALDIHPLAVQMVQSRAAKKKLANIETILSDGATGLADQSLDVVLLYDTFHDLAEPDEVLALRRSGKCPQKIPIRGTAKGSERDLSSRGLRAFMTMKLLSCC